MASSFAHREPDRPAPADGGPPEPPAGARDAEPATPDPANETEVDQRLLRVMADLDNMRKRFYREVAREREAERFRVAREWLPVVDDLDRAIEHATDDQQGAHMTGLRAVRDHALEVLARLGFPRFEDVGERFDPARHEAVSAVASDAEPGTILAVVRPGYGPPEVILRPAAVVVAAS
jgi:molecular chaperone GrpE